ncbi:ArsR family transcriptional regulator [Nakamurella silvestris]|nr:ArsR family transcriptional regulator [Nakamurella silvestris]
MHAFDVLGDPVRRRILELLSAGEQASGTISETIGQEFGISQPAVSQHLRVLRESGFTQVRPAGTRRLYSVNPEPLRDVDRWLDGFRQFWTPHFDALATELARGRRERRLAGESPATGGPAGRPAAGGPGAEAPAAGGPGAARTTTAAPDRAISIDPREPGENP